MAFELAGAEGRAGLTGEPEPELDLDAVADTAGHASLAGAMARPLVEVNTTLDRPTTTAPPACTQTCSPATGLVTALIQAG